MKSKILQQIKDDLHIAMKREVDMRKNEPGFAGFSKGGYDKIQAQKDVSRAIISMFPEIGTKPDKATDDETIRLIKKYISMEKTRELYQQKILTESDVSGLTAKQLSDLTNTKITEMGDSLTSLVIQIAQTYLPAQASEDEIEKWIKENIDFSQFKNKMQAMGPIMKQFKGCDGNIVKQILLGM